jgi:RNA polymerase sigma-70 factor (ECF subfamily)
MDIARQPTAPAHSGLLRASAPRLSIVTLERGRGAMPTSEELNELAKAVAAVGDRSAFAALFKHFAPRVKSYLVRLGSPEAAAEELAQETMVSVWRKAASFDADRAQVSTWIFTIARNLRIDHHRRQGGLAVFDDEHEQEDLPDTAPSPHERLSSRERESGVRAALAQLPPEQAHILRLSFYEEQPHASIARELSIPLGTVKSRVRLAVNHLRRLLDHLEP